MSHVTSHGIPIYYERTGSGPAVLFCHGAGSNGATWWQQIPVFREHFTCITFDNRCFGRSAAPLSAFRPEAFVDDVLAILDAERIDRVALVCQSLGGMTGTRLALRAPERIWAFACCDSPMAIDHAAMKRNVSAFLASVDATELEDRALSASFVRAQPALAFLYRQINQFNPAVHSPSQGLGWGARLAALSDDSYVLPMRRLADIRCPTLMVVGAEDPVVTPQVVRDVAQHIHGCRVVEIAGAGHSPYFEQAEAFNAAVLSFLHEAQQ